MIASTIAHHTRSGLPQDSTLLVALQQKPAAVSSGILELPDDEAEDACREAGGWEYINGEATGRNEYGGEQGLPGKYMGIPLSCPWPSAMSITYASR